MEHTLQINQVNLSSFKNYNIKEKRFKEKLVYIVTYASCTMPKALYKTNWNSYAKIKGHTQVLTTNGTQSETSCLIICLSKNLVKLCKYLKLSPDRTKFQIKKVNDTNEWASSYSGDNAAGNLSRLPVSEQIWPLSMYREGLAGDEY